jgi:fumarylacetoacetase
MTLLDASHRPDLHSWVESANAPDTDFPVQNLPYGRFRRKAGADAQHEAWRIGVAIGNQVLDLRMALEISPWGDGVADLLEPLAEGDLAAFMKLGKAAWRTVRAALSEALCEGSMQGPFLETALVSQADMEMSLPCEVGDYTDFYVGIHHARTVGSLFRPNNPLLPNYQWVPIGYHGRSSSIVVSGTAVRRPMGQGKAADADAPTLRPSRGLDYELELGALVAQGNPQGTRVGMDKAEDHLFGVVLFNDWSARDVQAWEYQPLGPFLSKSFCSSMSPWVVTLDALAPFRVPFTRPEGDPQPLPYLDSAANREAGAFSIDLEVWLQSAQMAQALLPPTRLMTSNFAQAAYWTLAQLVAHHTVNGCNLRTGDLFGTGTLSGPKPGQGGSMMELSAGGKQPLILPGGEQRLYLEDGDTVTFRAHCARDGARRIGFGSCSGTVLQAN